MKMTAAMDLQMMTACGSLERTAEQWEALVAGADPKLKLNSIKTVPGVIFAFILVDYVG